jgi:hypothetical protein
MGHIGYSFNKVTITLVVKGIEYQCQDNRERKTRYKTIKGNHQSIDHNPGELVGAKKLDKISQPHPVAAPDAFLGPEILESDLCSQHGIIFKNKEPKKRQKQKQIELPIISKYFPCVLPSNTGTLHRRLLAIIKPGADGLRPPQPGSYRD